MGETRVDLLHLLGGLRDAYPGTPEETLMTELVARLLDSAARTIAVTTEPTARTLTIADDGCGMRRRGPARYHDAAATTKVRGDTIGFASCSGGYHLALATALALSPLTVEPAKEHAFVTTFLGAWGEATERPRPGSRR